MKTKLAILTLVSWLFLPSILAADPIIYPAGGQSQEQQEQDKFQCYNWAKGETGFDPMQNHSVAAPQRQQGRAVSGAVGGAALGAIIGDSSDSAAKGAAAGALIGRSRQNRQNRSNEASAAQQQANIDARRHEYDRAYRACLTGRGYTVS
jgi:hypothetical protein